MTVVNEAWCLRLSGEALWGVQMPTPEEWTRYSTRSEQVGTSDDVIEALQLLGLSLPVTPEAITQSYRRAARQTHPDRNSAPDAVEKMQALKGVTLI